MPRKTKEVEQIPVKNTKKTTTKTTNTSKTKSGSKSMPSGTSTTKKMSTNKSAVTKSKTSTNTTSTKAKVVEKTANSKNTVHKSSNKKTTKAKKSKSDSVSVIEYYDLPYRYNQTIVKILAQTPQMLFVYWDIADNDRKLFEEHYGKDFFRKTKPVLIIHNTTMNYSFEIEINDFANSWYLHVNDADCKYVIELGRRPYAHTSTIKEDYIYISSSNQMASPNNHILFEKFNPDVTYKNTKTGATSKRDFTNLTNYKNMQEIYNIYDLYKTIYKDELFGEITQEELNNPSSSSFK